MLQICFVIFNPYNPTRHSLLHGTLCWVLFSRCEQSQSSEAQAASTDWTSRHDALRGRIQLLLHRLLHLAVATALSNQLSTPCEITITTCCCGSCQCTNISELCLGKLVGHAILQKELTKDTRVACKVFDDGHPPGWEEDLAQAMWIRARIQYKIKWPSLWSLSYFLTDSSGRTLELFQIWTRGTISIAFVEGKRQKAKAFWRTISRTCASRNAKK